MSNETKAQHTPGRDSDVLEQVTRTARGVGMMETANEFNTLQEARDGIARYLEGDDKAAWIGLDRAAKNEWAQRVLDNASVDLVAQAFKLWCWNA